MLLITEWSVLIFSALNVVLSLWLSIDTWRDLRAASRRPPANPIRRPASRFFFRAELLRLSVQIVFVGIGVSFVALGVPPTLPPGSVERIGAFAAGALLTALASLHAASFNLWLRRNI